MITITLLQPYNGHPAGTRLTVTEMTAVLLIALGWAARPYEDVWRDSLSTR